MSHEEAKKMLSTANRMPESTIGHCAENRCLAEQETPTTQSVRRAITNMAGQDADIGVQLLRARKPLPEGANNSISDAYRAERDIQVRFDKELRRDLDAQLQKLKSLPPSRERALCIQKLQEAIMWLGMDLKELNDERPYPTSYDPSSPRVEPTADGLKL